MHQPGSVVPALALADPWSPLEVQRLAAALRTPLPVPTDPPDPELLRFAGDGCHLAVYRASRSFRWRAEPGHGPLVGDRDALAILQQFERKDGGPLVADLAAREITVEATARPSHQRFSFSETSNGMRSYEVGRADTREATFAWEDTPLLNARLTAVVEGERLSSIDLFWNRPLATAGSVPTLTLDELDAVLRCKGLGRARWAATPRIVYRVGYPHVRQSLLVPLYRLAIRVGPDRGRQVAFLECTAFRAGPPPLHPRATAAPYLGDVLAL